jgi:hypothetical protein
MVCGRPEISVKMWPPLLLPRHLQAGTTATVWLGEAEIVSVVCASTTVSASSVALDLLVDA